MTKSWLWLTFSDICKWRVALVRQLTRSRAPVFVCFPFGWQFHFALSFLHLLAFQPLLAKYESSLSECMVSHICWLYNSVSTCYISMWCGSMSVYCLGMGWISTSHRSRWPLPGVVPCLSNVSCMFCGSCMERMCHSSRDVNVEYCCDCYRICRKKIMACWIMNYGGMTSDSLTTLASLICCRLLQTCCSLNQKVNLSSSFNIFNYFS